MLKEILTDVYFFKSAFSSVLFLTISKTLSPIILSPEMINSEISRAEVATAFIVTSLGIISLQKFRKLRKNLEK